MNGTAKEKAAVALGATLAEVLRTAVGDMDERLASGRYLAGGSVWHSPVTREGSCTVCLAGATFARYGVGPDEYVAGVMGKAARLRFGTDTGALGALEWLRAGDVATAAAAFYGSRAVRAAPLAERLERFHIRAGGTAREPELASRHRALDRWNEAREYYSGLAGRLAAAGL